jgi:hypothetical protein
MVSELVGGCEAELRFGPESAVSLFRRFPKLGCVRYSLVQISPPDPAYRRWAEVAAGVLAGTGEICVDG